MRFFVYLFTILSVVVPPYPYEFSESSDGYGDNNDGGDDDVDGDDAVLLCV